MSPENRPRARDLRAQSRRATMLIRLTPEHAGHVATIVAVGGPNQPQPGCFTKGRRDNIGQVVLNLVLNAADACQQSPHPKVVVRTEDDGEQVVLIVDDNGPGIAANAVKNIFRPFYTTKPRGQGTGLGLATVYGIVTRSGGSIAVTSEPGKGSVFTIYLPSQRHAAPPHVEPAAIAGTSGGSETVLLAEDEPAVRMLARRVLQRAGYTVVEAANPAEAEVKAASMPVIDMLLTDVMMPGGTGPELFRRLAATRPSLRVLFMSGYAEQDLFDRAAIDRAAPFLEKPFTVESLTARVRSVLDV